MLFCHLKTHQFRTSGLWGCLYIMQYMFVADTVTLSYLSFPHFPALLIYAWTNCSLCSSIHQFLLSCHFLQVGTDIMAVWRLLRCDNNASHVIHFVLALPRMLLLSRLVCMSHPPPPLPPTTMEVLPILCDGPLFNNSWRLFDQPANWHGHLTVHGAPNPAGIGLSILAHGEGDSIFRSTAFFFLGPP